MRLLRICRIAAILLLGMLGSSSGQSRDMTVTVKQGQHIRDIAKEYLQDADLWPEILRENGFDSVTDVKPGMQITIPSNIIEATAALNLAVEAIQEATKAGARLLAPASISNSIRMRDEAIRRRKNSDWNGCIDQAKLSRTEAKVALQESLDRNNVPAEAVLNDRRGNVQSRKQVDLLWNGVPLHSTFIEDEKVRTLSQSYGEILFRDESRLRLNENSQAIIQKMRMNILENRQVASVSLVEGDIYALLAGSTRKEFDVSVPGVETKINSNNFWMNNSSEGALFANYDGEMEVSSGGETVVLGQNQGTRVRSNQRPSMPRDLLPPPELLSPDHHGMVYQTTVNNQFSLRWKPVEGAAAYWLIVARDKSTFQNISISKKPVRASEYIVEAFSSDVYYWKVASIDQNGFPGKHSEPRLLKLVKDDRPPFLYLFSSNLDEVLIEPNIHIQGETERDASIYVDDEQIEVSPDGKFTFNNVLSEGLNIIKVKAVDIAGNVSNREFSTVYAPVRDIEIKHRHSLPQVGENQFVSKGAGFTLSGSTEPEAAINVAATTRAFHASSYSDKQNGDFSMSVPLEDGKNEFALSVVSRSNNVSEDVFSVETDRSAPVIKLGVELPPVMNENELRIQGAVEGGTELMLNQRAVSLSAGKFDETLTLSPGLNHIVLKSVDLAGNESLLEREVHFDQNPPDLIRFNVTDKTAAVGRMVWMQVSVKDDFGLKRTAPYTLKAGDFSWSGILKLNREMQVYKGHLILPAAVQSRIRLEVELADHCGNRKMVNYR
ncbi:hypothetical protein BVY01_05050 [bacterium I07]|nr:hypothetical protein BVY01_05050 [bacterium I07]